MDNKKTLFFTLLDAIGNPITTEEQRQDAWQQLVSTEDNSGFSAVIAAKFSWITIPEEYKGKAWQVLLKRGIENDSRNLHYLAVNAPGPWNKEARALKEKLLAKKS